MSLSSRGPHPASTVNSAFDLACAAATAASLIELALSESQRPMAELGEALSRVSAAVAAGGSAAAAPAGRQSWPVLMENLRARFTSESHRILFNLLMPDTEGHSHVPSLHASEGSVELF